MSYPDNFLKGISDEALVDPDGLVSGAAFYFRQPTTMDKWEQSICWEDDCSVIDLMKNQKREGKIQFKAGIARVPYKSVNFINALPMYTGVLSFERKKLADNPYHGNLLLENDTSKIKMKNVAAMIAGHVSHFISQP